MPTVILSVTVKFLLRHFGVWALAYIKLSLVNVLSAFSLFPMSDVIVGVLEFPSVAFCPRL